MDWPKARAILLAAFTAVNLILAYFIWGPSGVLPGVTDATHQQVVEQVRSTLAERGIILPSSVTVPRTPGPLRFIYVEYRPTPADSTARVELSGGVDPETQAMVYQLDAIGSAARELKLENRHQVQQAVEEYLRFQRLLPEGAVLSSVLPQADMGYLVVEFVPSFDGYPVFSGYVKAEVTTRGIEAVKQLWVQPRGYTDAPAKAVRPATEALLRLAGRLQPTGSHPLTIDQVELGYYANRSLTVAQPDEVNGWDTVPVWRISLDTGEVYYINAFNGEWES